MNLTQYIYIGMIFLKFQHSGTNGIYQSQNLQPILPKHPAPLPSMPNPQPSNPAWKALPPKLILKITQLKAGIAVSWTMGPQVSSHAEITSYQIYAYQEKSNQKLNSKLWNKVGDVKALPLPMACTLTQFQAGHKYYFAVRAKDVHQRVGPFSEAQSISLSKWFHFFILYYQL